MSQQYRLLSPRRAPGIVARMSDTRMTIVLALRWIAVVGRAVAARSPRDDARATTSAPPATVELFDVAPSGRPSQVRSDQWDAMEPQGGFGPFGPPPGDLARSARTRGPGAFARRRWTWPRSARAVDLAAFGRRPVDLARSALRLVDLGAFGGPPRGPGAFAVHPWTWRNGRPLLAFGPVVLRLRVHLGPAVHCPCL